MLESRGLSGNIFEHTETTLSESKFNIGNAILSICKNSSFIGDRLTEATQRRRQRIPFKDNNAWIIELYDIIGAALISLPSSKEDIVLVN